MKKLLLLLSVGGSLMAMDNDEGTRLVSLAPATQEAIYKATDGTHGLQPTKQDDMSRSIKTSKISSRKGACCCAATGLACFCGGASVFCCPAAPTAAALNAQVAAATIGMLCGLAGMFAGASINAVK